MPFDDLANDQDMQSMLKLRGRRPGYLPDDADANAEGDAADPNSLGMQIAQMGRRPYAADDAPAASAASSAANEQTPTPGDNSPQGGKTGSNLAQRILAATQRTTPEIVDMKAQVALPSRIQRSKDMDVPLPTFLGGRSVDSGGDSSSGASTRSSSTVAGVSTNGKDSLDQTLGRQFEGLRMWTENPSSRVPHADPPKQPLPTDMRRSQKFSGSSPEITRMAQLSVPGASRDNVTKYLPYIVDAVKKAKLGIPDSEIMPYVFATINAESAAFAPRDEDEVPKGKHFNTSTPETPGHHPFDLYDLNSKIGNNEKGDGERYKGRGFVQLTGRANYQEMGRRLGIDLLGNPELADDPQVASLIFAQFLKDRLRAYPTQAQALHEQSFDPQKSLNLYIRTLKELDKHGEYKKDLQKDPLASTRQVVNGGFNGMDRFLPAFAVGNQYTKVMKATAENPDITVGQVANIWTEIDPFEQKGAFMGDLKDKLGLDLNTSMSALNPAQRQAFEKLQDQYAHTLFGKINALAAQKQQAVSARKKQEQAAKAKAANTNQPAASKPPNQKNVRANPANPRPQ